MENSNAQPNTTALPAIPGSTGAKVLGIIAIIHCWFSIVPVFGWVLFIPSLVMGAVALSRGRRLAAEFARQPGKYSEKSAKSLKTARTTGLVAVIVCAVFFLISLVVLASGDALGDIVNGF